MGEAHLRGIQQMWATSEWQSICAAAEESDTDSDDSSSTTVRAVCSHTDPSAVAQLSPEEAIGVRQALLESAMRLKTVPSESLDFRWTSQFPLWPLWYLQ